MTMTRIKGRSLVTGRGQGNLLWADQGLSFWGGVDPFSAEVIDRHHPLSGQSLAGRVLAIPSGRGSCTGSSVLLELILNGPAPAALVLAEPDEILTLGALVAEQVFNVQLPVLCIGHAAFADLEPHAGASVRIDGEQLLLAADAPDSPWSAEPMASTDGPRTSLSLNARDRALLAGEYGQAAQVAMQLVLRMAELMGASELLDISQAHIDGCIYTGPACLRFAEQLRDWGAQVCVPTTLNAISVDQRRWRALGIEPDFGEPASALGDVYMAMGAQLSFTCAPYLLDSAPALGEQIVWAESNAVVYANSVLGARTLKYPDYLDICIALTGRAPRCGAHLDEGRRATLLVEVQYPQEPDGSFWPLLGYHVGLLAGRSIPLLTGLEHSAASSDDLKAFGAAFATTSAAPMFHIAGVTPEAPDEASALGGQAPARQLRVTLDELLESWRGLNSAESAEVSLVALGNPHCSATELARLAELCEGHHSHPDTTLVVTCGRAVHEQAAAAGHVATLERFGARLITDTCWCMLGEPVVPPGARTLMTNSGKYAHYAPGLVGRQVHFGSLAACVEAACSGRNARAVPAWLGNPQPHGSH
ncbi:aconitase family protein [Pseudomonas anguilliseptica]|uniref:cis-3-hydroxy-L-proline dehydratase n=1 Tax=Pseudomonas anguilliseptica TaxID=53406 RepID=UPI0022AEE523|nr:aconitase family protein [Pseudomonas anguilliseptica]MCZ4320482.1 aconitase family protein [Pseudomonas anguilliseptica]